MSDQPGLKQKAITWIVNRILDVTNRRVNIQELQAKYNAEDGRILEMHVMDLGRKWYFRVLGGKLEYLTDPKELAGGFQTNGDTLIALAFGKRKRMNPATGSVYEETYTPFDALTHGDIRIWGEAASNDALLFARAVHEQVYPQIQRELMGGAI